MNLPGPSRKIIVVPVEVPERPEREHDPAPPPEREWERDPAPPPERDPAPTPTEPERESEPVR